MKLLWPFIFIGYWLCRVCDGLGTVAIVAIGIPFSAISGWFTYHYDRAVPIKDWPDPASFTPRTSRWHYYFPTLCRLLKSSKHLLYMVQNQTVMNRRAFRAVAKP